MAVPSTSPGFLGSGTVHMYYWAFESLQMFSGKPSASGLSYSTGEGEGYSGILARQCS